MDILMIILSVVVGLALLGRIFPKFGHRVFGWHYVTKIGKFDGASHHGVCDYCGKKCLQDSNGDWF